MPKSKAFIISKSSPNSLLRITPSSPNAVANFLSPSGTSDVDDDNITLSVDELMPSMVENRVTRSSSHSKKRGRTLEDDYPADVIERESGKILFDCLNSTSRANIQILPLDDDNISSESPIRKSFSSR